jgi:hypothetical protein
MPKHNWNKAAGLLLKMEMDRQGLTSGKLAKRLKKIGVETTADSIRQKISRGTLKTTLLLQCMYVMGVDTVDIKHILPSEAYPLPIPPTQQTDQEEESPEETIT